MSSYPQTWRSLRDQEYRRYYSSDIGTGLAFQIRMLREKSGWTQEQLAQFTNKKQETISQWEDPNYGSYTLSSLKNLAEAFDVALLVEFVPYTELVGRNTTRTPQRLAPPSFTEEDRLHDAAGNFLTAPTFDLSYPRMLDLATTSPRQQVLPIGGTSPPSVVEFWRTYVVRGQQNTGGERYASQGTARTARAGRPSLGVAP